ncbi:SAV_2336 N-terminal domain-related protein [Streptomyces sp. NPDC054887]
MNNPQPRSWHVTAAPAEISVGLTGLAPVFDVAPDKWPALPLDYADACANALSELSRLSPHAAPSPAARDVYVPPTEPVPRTQPVTPPVWELVLVVDTGPSMSAWYPTVNRFAACAYELPLFRDVHVLKIEPSAAGSPVDLAMVDALGLSTADKPQRRKMIFVITDGVGTTWRRPQLWECLTKWAALRPVAVLHVLPYQSWKLSAIRTQPRKLRAGFAGCPNSRLLSQPPAPMADLLSDGVGEEVVDLTIPVLELRKGWLEQWVQLMVFNTQWARQQVALLPTELAQKPVVPHPAPSLDSLSDPSSLVAEFRTAASDTSFRLAVALAAAPLNRHIMQMIAAEMLPWASPRDLSAVLTSGLLRMVRGGSPHAPEWATVTFDFRPGVRQRLLEQGDSVNTRAVVGHLDNYLGSVVDAVRGSAQRMQYPTAARFPEVTAETLPYLQVECDVLATLGLTPDSPHRQAADVLDAKIAEYLTAAPVSTQ